jgi:hypothetical protein
MAGRPIRDADVTAFLFVQDPEQTGERKTRTSQDGGFAFEGLRAGRYRIAAAKPGYVRRAFLSSGFHDPGRDIDLAPNQSVNGVDIALPIAGSIAGRVVGGDGKPLDKARVTAFQRVTTGPLAGRLLGAQESAFTNIDGEFVIAGLVAGEYLIQAFATRMAGMKGKPLPDDFTDYEQTFYPSVIDDTGAAPVRVEEGRATSGVDIQLLATRRFTVSGTVLYHRDAVPAGTTVTAIGASAALRRTNIFATVRPHDGGFVLPGVRAGEVVLVAQTTAGAERLIDMVTLDVSAPRERVQLVLQPGARLSGRVVFEGSPPSLERPLRVFVPFVGQPVLPSAPNSPNDWVDVAADGTFALSGLLGAREIRVAYLPPEWIVLRIIAAGQEVTNKSVELKRGDTLSDVVIRVGTR